MNTVFSIHLREFNKCIYYKVLVNIIHLADSGGSSTMDHMFQTGERATNWWLLILMSSLQGLNSTG